MDFMLHIQTEYKCVPYLDPENILHDDFSFRPPAGSPSHVWEQQSVYPQCISMKKNITPLLWLNPHYFPENPWYINTCHSYPIRIPMIFHIHIHIIHMYIYNIYLSIYLSINLSIYLSNGVSWLSILRCNLRWFGVTAISGNFHM